MKYLILLFSIFLSGCLTAVPIKQSFPSVPETMLTRCLELQKLENNSVVLSEMVKSVVNNYALYHECALKTEAWIEWYETNKLIFNRIK